MTLPGEPKCLGILGYRLHRILWRRQSQILQNILIPVLQSGHGKDASLLISTTQTHGELYSDQSPYVLTFLIFNLWVTQTPLFHCPKNVLECLHCPQHKNLWSLLRKHLAHELQKLFIHLPMLFHLRDFSRSPSQLSLASIGLQLVPLLQLFPTFRLSSTKQPGGSCKT